LYKQNHYYHLTEKYSEKNIRLVPFIDSKYRGPEEPQVSRICVCDSMAGCFVSVYFWEFEHSWNMYRTSEPVYAVKPYGILDSKVTGEHWLLEPTKFDFICNLKSFIEKYEDELFEYESIFNRCSFGDGEEKTLKYQKRCKRFISDRLKEFLDAQV